jgi:hypothetical protein
MPAKRNPSSSPTKRRRPERPKPLYSSLAQRPTPAERRQEVEKRIRQRGLAPIEDFDRYLEDVSDFWPKTKAAMNSWFGSAGCGERVKPGCPWWLSAPTWFLSDSKRIRALARSRLRDGTWS